ncbi:MAG TPA: TIR domain-containing protein [Lacunisphaera sp.]
MSVESSTLDVGRSAPHGAVFLSYASQDTEAVKKIADALRAAGVEVWFDQSELVGGDAWDQKIRKQIGNCALFVPIISANTQSRSEGYFRLEWKLADRRTDLIGKSKTFLMPVCIDDTRDSEADVPDSFLAVQWTRLKGGETTPAFVARVKKLLDGEMEAGRPRPAEPRGGGAPPPKTPRFGLWLATAAVTVVALALSLTRPWQRAITTASATEKTITSPQTEAQKLTAQARALALHDRIDEVTREDFALAEQLLKRAVESDPLDGEAWAAYAQCACGQISLQYDSSQTKREEARSRAEHAIKLAPDSNEARFAWAWSYRFQPSSNRDEVLRLHRELVERMPTDKRVLRQAGRAVESVVGTISASDNPADRAEAQRYYERAAALPGGDAIALRLLSDTLFSEARFAEAEKAVDQAIALRPTAGHLYTTKAFHQLFTDRDLTGAQATIAKIPATYLLDDQGAYMAAWVWLWSRKPEECLGVLRGLNRDYIDARYFTGPKAALTGQAHEMAGRHAAALAEWRIALQKAEQRYAADPSATIWLAWKAELLARLGEREAAENALQLFEQLAHEPRGQQAEIAISARILLGRHDEVLDGLEKHGIQVSRLPPGDRRYSTLGDFAYFRWNPIFDPLRSNPRFQKLLQQAEPIMAAQGPAPENGSSPAPVNDKSVAVLAFANLSDDKANEYFSDGISEELLNVLAKVPGLKVSARTSAFYFKGKEVPVPEIARQLGVAYVVEGSVRKQGEKVRITAQLIKAADGFHVWSDTFTRDLKDIFAVQDEIAGLIAGNLQLKMGIAQAESRRVIDPQAYQEYLLGRSLVAAGSTAQVRDGLGHLREAVRLDASLTAGWVQIARAYVHLSRWGGLLSTEDWAEAHRAIDRAVLLEPDSPDVWLALGWMRRTADWNWLGAEHAMREALRLRPDHAETLASLGIVLANLGREQEAVGMAKRAAELDPLNAATQMDLLSIFYANGRYPEAERAGRRAVELLPGGQIMRSWLALSVVGQGRFEEAEAIARLEPEPFARQGAQIMIAIKRGRTDEARSLLQDFEEKAQAVGGAANSYAYLAFLWGQAGDQDKAYEAIVKTRDIRDPSIAWVRTNFYRTGLGGHPRWPEFLHSVGLADDQLK